MSDSSPSAHSQALHLACPACSRELLLEMAHLGVQGFCPECQVPIVARRDSSGEVAVQRLDQTDAAPQSEHALFTQAKPSHRSSWPIWAGLLTFLALCAFVVLGGMSLKRSGRLFDFRSPEITVPVPVPLAVTPMELNSAEPTPEPPAEAAPEAVPAPAPLPDDPRKKALATTAEETLRAFLAADRPWEKLRHVLDPEEDLLSILDYKELDPVEPDAPLRQVEVLRVEAERRWATLITLPEKDGSQHVYCLVHREPDGAARLDFTLYWQNRSDLLRTFVEGEPKSQSLTARVELRRLPEEPPDGALRLAVNQAYSSFPAVELAVSASSPLANELKGRIHADTPVPALVEIVWTTGESRPAATISRIIQWGIWNWPE